MSIDSEKIQDGRIQAGFLGGGWAGKQSNKKHTREKAESYCMRGEIKLPVIDIIFLVKKKNLIFIKIN